MVRETHVLLLADARLDERRRAVAGPLAPLLASLTEELEPVLGASPWIPRDKALLSRAGGRCELDGAALDFDPASPHAHRCPVCGRTHRGELHHRAWITSYQLWLAERALHAALFNVLAADERHASFARNVLREYADLYLRYPNVDNVLGPTRLFFSTYLESIWLLQICVAADLLRRSGDSATCATVIDRIVQPARALISEYDEGLSNRQVWNNAALLAAAALCDDDAAFDARLHGASGLEYHMERGLFSDGTWYEGENYHQFALRGLWYGVALAEARGGAIPGALMERFHHAFAASYVSALPDFTMPSRKDSQYAVTLRQWRMAELAELGFARTLDPLLGSALGRSYEPGHERRDTGRARSAADVERNMPPSALTRADLGWRALLHALPKLPPLPDASPRSALLEGQGLAIFRRDRDVYVAVDYGQSGGGHGHPDRLNLTMSQGSTRWLDDMGTGSYVDPSLHWYRSTLAHNAPIVNGASQSLADGQLLAHDEREGLGWIEARFAGDPDVELRRVVVVAPGYVVDELHWKADVAARIELPWHLEGRVQGVSLRPAALRGGRGIEDGYDHVSNAASAGIPAHSTIRIDADRDGRRLRLYASSPGATTLFSADGPGQPPTTPRQFFVLRTDVGGATAEPQRAGCYRAVLAWRDEIQDVSFEADRITVLLDGGERHVHSDVDGHWRVELSAGNARSSVDLDGRRPPAVPKRVSETRRPAALRRSVAPGWLSEAGSGHLAKLLTYDLAEAHYRRSESSWEDSGRPRATVAIAAEERQLVFLATVEAGDCLFAPAGAVNALDNEHPDTMQAGLQLYARTPDASGGWMLVPDTDSDTLRVREVAGWGGLPLPRGRWRRWRGGYECRIELPIPQLANRAEYDVDIDLLINETIAGRQRRRGQLVTSGAAGEWVYLRGDRHDVRRLIPLVIVP